LCIYSLIPPSYHPLIHFLTAAERRGIKPPEIKEETINNAVKAGALRSSTKIVEIEEIPLAYLPSNAVRIRAKAVGDLA
jgi:hypothetical protein